MRDPSRVPRDSGQRCQTNLRILRLFRSLGLERLDVNTQRCPFRAGAGKPLDDSRIVFEAYADALRVVAGAIHRVGVGEVVRKADTQPFQRSAG